jgi:hypothetical protein
VVTKIFLKDKAGDSLNYHNGMKFSTKDRDNDQSSANCAVLKNGAWWYKDCYKSNLNGQYFKAGQTSSVRINWYHWKNDWRSLMKTEMKICPAQC